MLKFFKSALFKLFSTADSIQASLVVVPDESAQSKCDYITRTFNPRENTAKNPEDQMIKTGIPLEQIKNMERETL